MFILFWGTRIGQSSMWHFSLNMKMNRTLSLKKQNRLKLRWSDMRLWTHVVCQLKDSTWELYKKMYTRRKLLNTVHLQKTFTLAFMYSMAFYSSMHLEATEFSASRFTAFESNLHICASEDSSLREPEKKIILCGNSLTTELIVIYVTKLHISYSNVNTTLQEKS